MEKISQKINYFLNSLDSQKLNKGILIAFSGGRDSMVLLDVLVKMLPEKRIAVLYVNHNLRGDDSIAEEAFVKKTIIEKYKLPLFTRNVDVAEWQDCGSIENKARKIRYDFFAEILKQENFGFIATAHHLNDKIETFFLNLLRGGSLQSLSSIPAVNHDIIRPLLNVSRKQINDYVKDFSIEYVEDKTNSQPLYKRNRIRNEVIPLLESLSGNLEASFDAVFASIDSDVQFLEQETVRRLGKLLLYNDCNVWCIDRRKFTDEPSAVRCEIIKKICYHFDVQPGRQLIQHIANAQHIDIKKNNMKVVSKGKYLWFFPSVFDYNVVPCEKIGKYYPGDFAFSLNVGRLNIRTVLLDDEIDTPNGRQKIVAVLKKCGIPTELILQTKVLFCENAVVAGYFCFGFFGVSTQFYVGQNDEAKIFSFKQSSLTGMEV